MLPHTSAHQITDYIFVGGYKVADNPNFLKKFGITNIVKLYSDNSYYRKFPTINYIELPTLDLPEYDISEDAAQAIVFIRNCILNNERVFVHCHAGISRSVTVVILYLMVYEGLTLNRAYSKIKKKRFYAWPNSGFMKYLHDVERRISKCQCCLEEDYLNHVLFG
jgi:protein-tyrosine phosphatase